MSPARLIRLSATARSFNSGRSRSDSGPRPLCNQLTRKYCSVLCIDASTTRTNKERICKTQPSQLSKIFKEVFLQKIGRWILLNVHPDDGGLIILHSDVTEKVKFRESLEKKELQLKTLIENVPDLVTRWSGDAQLLFANTSFYKKEINSFSKGDLNLEINKSSDLTNWENKIKKAFKTGKNLSHHTTLSTKNGEAYLESSIIPEKNVDGKTESVLAISRDVTENKLAEKKILDAKNFLQSVFDASVNGIIALETIKDKNDNIIDFKCILSNNSSTKILGYNPIDYSFLSVIKKSDIKTYFDKFKTLISQGLRIEEEVFYSYKRGKVWLHLVAEKLNNGILLTFSDITKRKEAERKNIKTLELLQNLINGSPVILVHYKIDKDKDNNITDFTILNSNNNASRLVGMDTIQLKGKKLLQIMPSAFNHEFGKLLINFALFNTPNRFETHYNKDGLDNWWDISLVKKSGGIILTGINITKKIESEKRIKELQHLQQAQLLNAVMQTQEEERRRVAESLHNDFGQLLNIAVIKLGKENKEVTDILNDSIKKMRSISYELMPPLLKDFGLEVALKDMLEVKTTSSNINISYAINGLKTKIERDLEVAIYRISQELLNNAIKHSDAEKIELVINNNNKKVTISINDNGKGFDAAINKRRFGLKYISDRINLLNGTFSISTKKNSGTKCYLEIPLVAKSKS
ncbi:MAG: PAS domain-containing protein [Pedobacter sp.]|nr:MAG: PAS domain-containing protein [Pedobacter sp.]